MNEEPKQPEPDDKGLDVPVTSVAIQRIIDEMRNERAGESVPRNRYDRSYNRHNRS